MVKHDSKEADECKRESVIAGFISGLKASVVCGGLYYLAWNKSHMFRTGFNASARVGLTVMPIFYTAWLNVEQHMHECVKRHAPGYLWRVVNKYTTMTSVSGFALQTMS